MKDTFIVIFLRLLSWLSLSQARVLGRSLGGLATILNTRMTATTRTNIRLCYPALSAQEQNLLVKHSMQHTFQTITEAGAVWLWPLQKVLNTIVVVEGETILSQAFAAGKGVLVIAPHLGNWEVFGLYLNACGIAQSHQMYQPPRSAVLGALISKARSRAGANMVPTDRAGVAELLKALKRGEIVGVLPDQVPPRESGEYATFFGKQVLTMSLITRLQQKTGAVVVSGYARRSPGGFEVRFREVSPEVYAGHMQEALVGLNLTIEALVNEAPEQYQWDYKRFRRLADNEISPYQ